MGWRGAGGLPPAGAGAETAWVALAECWRRLLAERPDRSAAEGIAARPGAATDCARRRWLAGPRESDLGKAEPDAGVSPRPTRQDLGAGLPPNPLAGCLLRPRRDPGTPPRPYNGGGRAEPSLPGCAQRPGPLESARSLRPPARQEPRRRLAAAEGRLSGRALRHLSPAARGTTDPRHGAGAHLRPVRPTLAATDHTRPTRRSRNGGGAASV